MPSSLNQLMTRLNYVFKHPALLTQALTHRSANAKHNERLEFLGDAVLDLIITESLFERLPEQKEGDLSRIRAQLVRQETLAEIATQLNLGNFLILGQGEASTGGAERASILADALEAVFGAILRDANYQICQTVVLNLYQPYFDQTQSLMYANKDNKTRLQEYLHAHKQPLPTYSVTKLSGAGHSQQFVVMCHVTGIPFKAKGHGNSRRIAEQVAANILLQYLINRKEQFKISR